MAFDPEQILDQLESDVATYLAGDPWFAQARLLNGSYITIPVLTEEPGDIDSATQQALSMAGPGICLQVRAMEWDVQYVNAPGPYIEKIDMKIVGLEVVPRNRGTASKPSPTGTLRKLKATMIRAQEVLHLWTPPCLTRALTCGPTRLMTVLDENGSVVNGVLGYESYFRAAGGVGFTSVPKVTAPTMSYDGTLVTLTCATPGASIWYTTDNANPSPRTGWFYTAPFAAAAPCTIKARGFIAYHCTSDLLSQSL